MEDVLTFLEINFKVWTFKIITDRILSIYLTFSSQWFTQNLRLNIRSRWFLSKLKFTKTHIFPYCQHIHNLQVCVFFFLSLEMDRLTMHTLAAKNFFGIKSFETIRIQCQHCIYICSQMIKTSSSFLSRIKFTYMSEKWIVSWLTFSSHFYFFLFLKKYTYILLCRNEADFQFF